MLENIAIEYLNLILKGKKNDKLNNRNIINNIIFR